MSAMRSVYRLWVRDAKGSPEGLWVVSTHSDLQSVKSYSCIERIETRADIFPSPIDIDYVLPVDEESLKRCLARLAA